MKRCGLLSNASVVRYANAIFDDSQKHCFTVGWPSPTTCESVMTRLWNFILPVMPRFSTRLMLKFGSFSSSAVMVIALKVEPGSTFSAIAKLYDSSYFFFFSLYLNDAITSINPDFTSIMMTQPCCALFSSRQRRSDSSATS